MDQRKAPLTRPPRPVPRWGQPTAGSCPLALCHGPRPPVKHPYTISDTAGLDRVVRVDQRTAPADHTYHNQPWKSLGLYTVGGDVLVVQLSDDADALVVADAVLRLSGVGIAPLSGGASESAAVQDRHVFYDNCWWDDDTPGANENGKDDDARDPLKSALLPGEDADGDEKHNHTGYRRGVNGVMVDISNLAAPDDLSDDDFQFKVGTSNDPSQWSAPAQGPADFDVRQGAGEDPDAYRVTIIFSDNVIEETWLQVTVRATSDTGLPVPDVFYFGNLIGDASGSDSVPGAARVGPSDLSAVAQQWAPGGYPPAEGPEKKTADFERDKDVDPSDLSLVVVRNGNTLPLIEVPGIVLTRFYSDWSDLVVDYTIENLPGPYANEFDVRVYRSYDKIHPAGPSLMTHTIDDDDDLTPGDHVVAFDAVFEDVEEDYYLMAVIESDLGVKDNNFLFEGGVFEADYGPNTFVHVHGKDPYDEDPDLDKRDLVEIALGEQPTDFWVELNGEGHPYVLTDYGEFHIRTHEGHDQVVTPNPDDLNNSGIFKAIWAFGGNGDDVIAGGDDEDRLYGGEGDDAICGRADDDFIYGEQGDDELEGIGGDDWIEAGPGNDVVEGWGGSDTIYGGAGDDTLRGGFENAVTADGVDRIFGGDGNDRIDGYKCADWLYGDGYNDPEHAGVQPGNDEIYGHDGWDHIYGGPGHDNLFGENQGAYVDPGPGDDWIKPLDPDDKYPRVDLLANIVPGGNPGEWEDERGSWDNREENGFYGGKGIWLALPWERIEMRVHENGVELDGKILRLENTDPSVVQVWNADKTEIIETPKDWIIGTEIIPEQKYDLYAKGVNVGHGAWTLTVIDPATGEPVPDRPLPDYLRFTVTAGAGGGGAASSQSLAVAWYDYFHCSPGQRSKHTEQQQANPLLYYG